MYIKRFITILSLFLIFTAAWGQTAEESPIKWRMTVKMTSAREGVVTMKAIISDGWHLYGTKLPANGPVPTTFDFSASKGIQFVGDFTPSEKAVSEKDATFGLVLDWWTKSVSFTRKFRLTGDISSALVAGSVRYMGCNNQTCMPPKTQSFNTKIKPFKPTK